MEAELEDIKRYNNDLLRNVETERTIKEEFERKLKFMEDAMENAKRENETLRERLRFSKI